MPIDFYLASRSPRRVEMLRALGYRFESLPADIDETPRPGESPAAFARRMAEGKARAAAALAGLPQPLVLGADTDVSIDGVILGKPADRAHALAMLARLSGRSHWVCSAVVLVGPARCETVETLTEVVMGPIEPQEAEAYWASGEPADKAGAYAIQGLAARWIQEIHGSYSGVVGLPLLETVALLKRFGIHPAGQDRR